MSRSNPMHHADPADPPIRARRAKHTPGPWLIARVDNIDAIVTPEGDAIFDTRGASAADLTLAVNAPLMLAALQRITHPMADDSDVDFALAIIARATRAD